MIGPGLLTIASTSAFFVSTFRPTIPMEGTHLYDYWSSTPAVEDLRRVAKDQRRDGIIGLRCSVTFDGRLDRCRVAQQLGGAGFGSAALSLSHKFMMKQELARIARSSRATVLIKMPFCANDVCNPPEWRGYKAR